MGAISIILSGYVLAQPGLAFFTTIPILSIVLLFVGIRSALYDHSLVMLGRHRVSVISGFDFSNCFFHLVTTLLPPPPISFAIFLGGFAILFNGIGGIMQGVGGQGISRWFRAPLVGVGVLSILISGLIIAHPVGFGDQLLAIVMSFLPLIIGMEITTMGVVGRE